MLAVDGSYQYVHERDRGLFVVKTMNHCQSAETIAYAICNQCMGGNRQLLGTIFL